MRLLQLKRVLVSVDLDDTSAAALRTAARLAALAEARLYLLHVADRPGADDEARLLERFRAAAPGASAPDEIRVAAGGAPEVIVQQAALREADVVILGPHRRGGGGGELGSTAASVVGEAACPCLVTATELHLPLEQVVAAIDDSQAAAGVLGVALSWATALRPRSADLRLDAFHVSSEATDAAERWLRGEVSRAQERAAGAPHVNIRETVSSGSEPAVEILAQASSGADLLVMGTRGKLVSRMGSISAAVVRDAPCPLLLVPPAVWLQESPGSG